MAGRSGGPTCPPQDRRGERRRVRRPAATVILLLAFLASCRGTTPEPVVRADRKAQPAPAPAPAAEPAEKSEPVRDDKPVVVEPGGEAAGKPVSLVEAARAERERRAHAGEPVAVITDKTLPAYAAKGQLTVADVKGKKGAEPAAPPAPSVPAAKDEQYWRGRALEIRQRWRRAADDVKELEQESTELRQKFYLESDTFTRDNQIKPQWDRVLDKLRQARLDAAAAEKELAQFLEEGRAAGALPGWLREGEEEEPAPPKKKEAPPPAQSIEPPVIEPPPLVGDDGGGR
jgi:hypothetical protein